MEQFNLTPSPALLELLGKIQIKGWQCVAELIDNSIDALINNFKDLSESQKIISVHIPTKVKMLQNESLIIEDWGVGMTEQQLENSVKAGYSSKGTNSNLGLFGMGFNLATSRLANTVQVWTSTAEMTEEIGVNIDLREMRKTGSFNRPKMTRNKRPDKISGTRIEIYDYRAEAQNYLKPQEIYRELNRAYSERIFSEYGIKIIVNIQEVIPFKFCVWNEERFVKHKYDEIHAIIEIDKHIGEELFCENCFSWLGDIVDTGIKIECPQCKSQGKILKKDIYIVGWVGIQRYSDVDHFGIDISRNGRILSRLDKSLFSWDDERATEDYRFHPEYPRDTTYAGGRIVGQIEANFVVPIYTKDDFQRDDKNWRKVIKFLRGEMPLQPDLAGLFGYGYPNKSPIALLFNAYRKINVPGSKTLVFARENGSVDHSTPKSWAQKFYNKEPGFIDDSKWWEAVTKADLKENQSNFNPLNPLNKNNRVTSPDQIKVTSADNQKFPGKKILMKSFRFDIEKLINERPFDLTLFDYTPDGDFSLPLVFEPDGQSRFKVYLNNRHIFFRDFADGYEDLIYMEVAFKYATIKNNPIEWPITRIYYELKSKYAPETMLDVQKLVARANNLMKEIQKYLVRENGITLPRPVKLLAAEEKVMVNKYLDLEGKSIQDINGFITNTKFLKYLDLSYTFKFIELYPELVFDNKIFSFPYADLDSDNQERMLKKYLGYLNDVRWFMYELSNESEEIIKKLKRQIIRNRYSIEILYEAIIK